MKEGWKEVKVYVKDEGKQKVETPEEVFIELRKLANEFECRFSVKEKVFEINNNLSDTDWLTVTEKFDHWNNVLKVHLYTDFKISRFTPKANRKKGRPTDLDPDVVFKLIIEKRNKVKKEKFTCSYVFNYILKPLMLSEGYLRTTKVKKYLNLIPALKGKNQSVWQHIITDKHIKIIKEQMKEQKN